jgi:hypothetical protein
MAQHQAGHTCSLHYSQRFPDNGWLDPVSALARFLYQPDCPPPSYCISWYQLGASPSLESCLVQKVMSTPNLGNSLTWEYGRLGGGSHPLLEPAQEQTEARPQLDVHGSCCIQCSVQYLVLLWSRSYQKVHPQSITAQDPQLRLMQWKQGELSPTLYSLPFETIAKSLENHL